MLKKCHVLFEWPLTSEYKLKKLISYNYYFIKYFLANVLSPLTSCETFKFYLYFLQSCFKDLKHSQKKERKRQSDRENKEIMWVGERGREKERETENGRKRKKERKKEERKYFLNYARSYDADVFCRCHWNDLYFLFLYFLLDSLFSN